MKGVLTMTDTTTYIKKGDIFYADLGSYSEQKGSIQCGVRPCIVCGNNLQNKYSEVILISPITSSAKKNRRSQIFLRQLQDSSWLSVFPLRQESGIVL